MPKLRVEAEIGANITPLERAFAKAKSAGAGLGSALKGHLAAAFSVGAVSMFVRGVVQAAEKIKDMASQMQVSNKEAQQVAFEARQVGLEYTNVAAALDKLTEARQKAGEGEAKQIATFRKLGISMEDIQNPALSTLDLMKKIGRSMEGANATDVGAFLDVFGANAVKLMEVVKALGEGRNTPGLMSDEDIQNIDDAAKAWEALKLQMMAAAAPVIASVMQSISDSIKTWTVGLNKAKEIMQFIKDKTLLGKIANYGPNEMTFGKEGMETHHGLPEFQRAKTGNLFTDQSSTRHESAAADAMTKLYEAQAKTEFDKLSMTEKRLEIERKISNLQVAASHYGENDAERFQALTEAENLKQQLAGLESKGGGSISSDALGRIGGVLNGSRRDPVMQDQLRELKMLTRAAQEQLRILRGGL